MMNWIHNYESQRIWMKFRGRHRCALNRRWVHFALPECSLPDKIGVDLRCRVWSRRLRRGAALELP
eukprot:3133030-Alexandrium_andersonii.AAC.1